MQIRIHIQITAKKEGILQKGAGRMKIVLKEKPEQTVPVGKVKFVSIPRKWVE